MPEARQISRNAIETLTLHTVRAFIASMYYCHNTYSGNDCQKTACQQSLSQNAHHPGCLLQNVNTTTLGTCRQGCQTTYAVIKPPFNVFKASLRVDSCQYQAMRGSISGSS